MPSENITQDNVKSYSGFAHHTQLFGAERIMLESLISPGMRILDIGCGTGRVARAMQQMGATVDACDLNAEAIEILIREDTSKEIIAKVGDASNLPYEDSKFDLVIFAFNGLDFLYPKAERSKVILEMTRVLKSNGTCIFSSHNSIGGLLSPRGIRNLRSWGCKLRQLISGEVSQEYHHNHQGLLLYHATPSKIIRHVEEISPLRFERLLNKDGNHSNPLLIKLFSNWPYYQFRKL